MKTLPTIKELTEQTTWNKRYKWMAELVHESYEARTLIVEALGILKLSKDLSYGERKMLDLAINYEQHKAEHEQKVKNLEDYRKKNV